VNEIDRRWPTQVDAVAIDGATMQVVDRTHFADFPLMAKLTRWGVDFHMGILLVWRISCCWWGLAARCA
jgi:uncharacterized iron-regulated membrane protein